MALALAYCPAAEVRTNDSPDQNESRLLKIRTFEWYDPEFYVNWVKGDIELLRRLPPNWNGYGAERVNPRIIESAIDLTDKLGIWATIRPSVVPMTRGRLQFEFINGTRLLELEFESPQSIRYLKWDPPSNTEEEDSISVSQEKDVMNLLKWVAE